MRSIPSTKVVAFAQILDQLESTAKAELRKFFFEDEFVTFNKDKWVLKNGSQIEWYTSDSEQKIRGMNVGIAWLLESSGIKHEIFKQLMTRTRQDELKVFLRDDEGKIIFKKVKEGKKVTWQGIVVEEYGMLIDETNPTYEWPRDKALFKSHTIMYTPSVRGIREIVPFIKPQTDPEAPDKILDMVSVLFSSIDNPMMTEEYISTIRSTYDSKEEYDRDIYCDMSYAQGLIYGTWIQSLFVPVTDTYADGMAIHYAESIDPGGAAEGNDETGYLFAKIKTNKSVNELPEVTILDGYKKDGLSTAEEATNIWEVRNRYGWTQRKSLFFAVDPHGVKNEKKTKSNLIKDISIWNIHMSKEGVNDDPDHGIKRVIDFLKAGKLKIAMSNPQLVEDIKDELSTYMWTKSTVRNSSGNRVQKPTDRNNHLLDSLRFLISKVPVTPQALIHLEGDKDFDYTKRKYSANSLNPYDYQQKSDDEYVYKSNGDGNIYYQPDED